MNNLKMLLCLALVLICAHSGAIAFNLIIEEVNTSSVYGTLDILNLSDEDVVIEFPSAGTFDIMVDGNISEVFYPDMLTTLTIPSTSTISLNVSYVGSNTFGPGSHLCQTRYVLPGNPPAGRSRTFYVGTPITGIENLEYQFELTEVHEHGVTGRLQMYNRNQQHWVMEFPWALIARIFIDGQPEDAAFQPMTTSLYIDPGETHIETIFLWTTQPFTAGWHTAQARLFLVDDPPVGGSVPFLIEPTAIQEEIAPAAQALRLNLYPNPCASDMCISLNSRNPVWISIYDVKGRKMMETLENGEFQWNGLNMSGKPCPAGIYFVRARQGTESAVQRFVKLR